MENYSDNSCSDVKCLLLGFQNNSFEFAKCSFEIELKDNNLRFTIITLKLAGSWKIIHTQIHKIAKLIQIFLCFRIIPF